MPTALKGPTSSRPEVSLEASVHEYRPFEGILWRPFAK